MKSDRERNRRAYSIIGLLIIAAVIISMVASAVITTPAP
jgi:hypothetical protein